MRKKNKASPWDIIVNCDECAERVVTQDEYDKCDCGAEVHGRCMDRHLGHCDGLKASDGK